MSLQQPILVVGEDGAARKGLILRHLVLPGCVEDSLAVIRWARNHLSPFIGLSLMSQYRPCFRAPAEINRSLDGEEYRVVKEELLGLGFEHVFIQPEPFKPEEHLVPDFRKKEPFRWKETKP
jgi:putative pyruvate formate lyase activating enzyme